MCAWAEKCLQNTQWIKFKVPDSYKWLVTEYFIHIWGSFIALQDFIDTIQGAFTANHLTSIKPS